MGSLCSFYLQNTVEQPLWKNGSQYMIWLFIYATKVMQSAIDLFKSVLIWWKSGKIYGSVSTEQNISQSLTPLGVGIHGFDWCRCQKIQVNSLLRGASVSGEQITWQLTTISIILIFRGGSVLNSIYYGKYFSSSPGVVRKKICTLITSEFIGQVQSRHILGTIAESVLFKAFRLDSQLVIIYEFFAVGMVLGDPGEIIIPTPF